MGAEMVDDCVHRRRAVLWQVFLQILDERHGFVNVKATSSHLEKQ